MKILRDLEQRGVTLAPKLTFSSAAPLDAETLALIHDHKADLLRALVAPDAVPRLPWQLEALLRAATSNVLTAELPGVPDTGRYVLAWGCAYLVSDRDEAEQRLWAVYRAWKGVN